jgi:hypothetical protein
MGKAASQPFAAQALRKRALRVPLNIRTRETSQFAKPLSRQGLGHPLCQLSKLSGQLARFPPLSAIVGLRMDVPYEGARPGQLSPERACSRRCFRAATQVSACGAIATCCLTLAMSALEKWRNWSLGPIWAQSGHSAKPSSQFCNCRKADFPRPGGNKESLNDKGAEELPGRP